MSKRGNNSETDDPEDTSPLRKYTIIQFIKRGRPSARRELDIVPTDWIYFNKQRDRCTTQFPEDFSNPEDRTFLHDLVRTCGDPPEAWKMFSVEIRGRANTYEEALQKLTLLNDVESVLTCSENDTTNVKDRMIDNIKRRKLQDQLNTLKEKLAETDVDHDRNSILRENNVPLDKPQSNHESVSISTANLLPGEQLPKRYEESSTTKSTQENLGAERSEKQDGTLPMEPVDYEEIVAAAMDFQFPVINASNVHCKSDFEAAVIAQLSEISRKLTDMSIRQDELTDFVLDKQITLKVRNTDFLKKYKVKLPMDEQEVFINFDEQIKTNNFLERDVLAELNGCLDKDLSASKSYLAMLRAFITKNVAVKYTASRKSTTDKENPKTPFKFTKFYTCMESVLLSAKKKRNVTIDQKDLIAILSNIISNAPAWDKKK